MYVPFLEAGDRTAIGGEFGSLEVHFSTYSVHQGGRFARKFEWFVVWRRQDLANLGWMYAEWRLAGLKSGSEIRGASCLPRAEARGGCSLRSGPARATYYQWRPASGLCTFSIRPPYRYPRGYSFLRLEDLHRHRFDLVDPDNHPGLQLRSRQAAPESGWDPDNHPGLQPGVARLL